jgi:agmatinase
VNTYSDQVNRWVYARTKAMLEKNKIVGLIGGDHAVPYGAIKAHLERYPKMGILHFDAHHDLRKAYEGFTWSHASIFYNVIEKLHPKRLTQVGIRDYCDEEEVYSRKHTEIKSFRDRDIAQRKFRGETWKSIVDDILKTLPTEVYISFDIDGLEPSFCPATGTPVPGGLTYSEVIFLLRELHRSKRKVVGFDLVETGPDEWDANVAARLVYELSLICLAS